MFPNIDFALTMIRSRITSVPGILHDHQLRFPDPTERNLVGEALPVEKFPFALLKST